MASTILDLRASIRNKVDTEFVQPIYDTGVPTTTNLVRVDGVLEPYIIVTFNDLAPGRARNMGSTRGDDYVQSVNILFVAATPNITEQLQVKCVDKMLGFTPTYGGPLTKRAGGGGFVVQSSTGVTEAYVSMVSFSCSIDRLDV